MKLQMILRWFAYSSLELCFCGKIEPQIKTLWKRYQNKPKFVIWCDLTSNRQNMKFQLILRWFAYGSLRVVFLGQNWIILQISSNLSLSLSLSLSLYIYIYATDMIRDSNKMKYNLFFSFFVFCLDDADTKNKNMNEANTKKLKGTLKKWK
jgi:hypothetical protein